MLLENRLLGKQKKRFEEGKEDGGNPSLAGTSLQLPDRSPAVMGANPQPLAIPALILSTGIS